MQTGEQIFGPHGDRFIVDDLAFLQQIALGLVPLALAVPLLQLRSGRTGAGSSRSRL